MNSLGRTACCIQNFIYGQLPILWEREMVFKLQEREILAPIFSESKSSQVVDSTKSRLLPSVRVGHLVSRKREAPCFNIHLFGSV